MKALEDIITIEDKKVFLSLLNTTVCKEGRDALFSFNGSVEDYFLKHERGFRDLIWCLQQVKNIVLLIAFVTIHRSECMIKYLPNRHRKPEICLAAVKCNGYAIAYLTENERDPDVCLAAVQQNGFAISFLNDKQRTPKVCVAVVNQTNHAIQFFNKKQLNYIKENGTLFTKQK